MNNNKIAHRTILLLAFLSLGFILVSCYPGETLTPADSDVVATFFDKEADFSTKLTYAIRDSVTRIDEDGNPVFEVGQYDQQAIIYFDYYCPNRLRTTYRSYN